MEAWNCQGRYTEKTYLEANLPVFLICAYDAIYHSPPGSSVHGILQARILQWVACPSPGDLPNPGIKPGSPALQADSLPSEPQGKPTLIDSIQNI